MHPKRATRVVIAEDDFLVSKEISRAVKKIGHEVVAEVSTGEEAVEKTCELDPDVVLMDIQMPGMDGLQASKHIQACCPTPVVVLTAHDSQDLVERASDTGVGAYLTKPPDPLEVERAITISMARHADMMTCRALYEKLSERTRELEKALSEIKTLKGLLPICAACKKVRDDQGYWEQIEVYVEARSEAEFSHSICPECAEKLYPDVKIYDD
jgi:DNA-binding NarL/FixJ family response regulator